jgi:hypothetical protein
MKDKLTFSALLLLALSLALASTAEASTIWYVNGVHGNNSNNCKSPTTACKTIGHAIALASSGDSIMVAAATYGENLTIGVSLNVLGAGASTTIVDGGGLATVVTISSAGAHVTLSGLTITHGFSAHGGGVNNRGTLTVKYSTISANRAVISCYRFCNGGGGGIYNAGTLTVIANTLSGNGALADCLNMCSADGGGIYNNGGAVAINNSTFSGNSASVSCAAYCNSIGGGVSNSGTLRINNSTLGGNYAATRSYPSFALGGGIISSSASTVHLQNTILANNFVQSGFKATSNCRGSVPSQGYNLSSDDTCNFNNSGDRNNVDPKLGTLGSYGGPTQTIPLLSGSPAIDAGNPSGCTDGQGHLLTTDQRGQPRPDKEDKLGCDMGAYERQSD